MPRQVATSRLVNRNVLGLVTEASALSFPENASQDELNMEIMRDGSRRRRRGVDVEPTSTDFAPDENDLNIEEEDIWRSEVVSYKWESVNGTPNLAFIVVQVGPTLAFFNAGTAPITAGFNEDYNVELDQWEVNAADIQFERCQFTAGNGKLFVSHPKLDPIKIEYDSDTDTMEVSRISLRIRDLEGLDDELEVNERPSTLSEEHKYNLRNQGWFPGVVKLRPFLGYEGTDPIDAFATHIRKYGL